MIKNKANHFLRILEELSDANVEFVVGGGVAVVLHGIERSTIDIDLSLYMTRDNIRKFIEVMKKEGMRPNVPVSADVLLDPTMIKKMIEEKHAIVFSFIHPDELFKRVDIFLTEDLSYSNLVKNSEIMKLGKSNIRIVSKKKLLELKKAISPLRNKDIFDIKALEEILRENDDD